MKKGIDYTGIAVTFYCHDGKGNYVMHKRGDGCRDERGVWDFGGGGLKFNESLDDCVQREIQEEFGVVPVELKCIGFDEKFREDNGVLTHWIGFRYIALVDRSKVTNNEPDKHSEIGWFDMNNLPTPLFSLLKKDLVKYKDYL